MIGFGVFFLLLCTILLCRIYVIANAPIKLENKRVRYEKLSSEQYSTLVRIMDYIEGLNTEEIDKFEERFYKIYHELYSKTLPIKNDDDEIIDYPIESIKRYTTLLVNEYHEVFKLEHRESKLYSLLQ